MSRHAERVKEEMDAGRPDIALLYLANSLVCAAIHPGTDKSELYYLFGNVYRQKGEYALAMNYYTKAIEENPDSPAVEARKMLQGIMNFYNKDMYNH